MSKKSNKGTQKKSVSSVSTGKELKKESKVVKNASTNEKVVEEKVQKKTKGLKLSVSWKTVIKVALYFVITVWLLIIIDYSFQYLNIGYSAATISNKKGMNVMRVSKSEVRKMMETRYGQDTATELIENKLINNYVEKKGLTVTDREKDFMMLTALYSQGFASIDDVKEALSGESEDVQKEFYESLEKQVFLVKIATEGEEYSEEDAKTAFETYKEQFTEADYNALNHTDVRNFNMMLQSYMEKMYTEDVTAKLYEDYTITNNYEVKPKYELLKSTRNVIDMFKKTDED